ncbi:helicase-related protein [Verrucomicrobiota bacterium]
MSTKFFTNEKENTLLNKFAGIFKHNEDIEFFDALVGFLRASGYFAVRPYLENVPRIRLLVGINVDSIVADFHKRGLLFLADAGKTLREFRRDLSEDIQNANYSREVERGILQFVDDVASEKLEIRAHPSRRLHAKIYIFRPKGFSEHKPGAVITGSSNLTNAGLGAEENRRNYEFNVLLHDYDDVTFALDEFEKLWAEAVSILPKDVQSVKNDSYLNEGFTPFELYIKFLAEYFGTSVDFDPNAVTDLPPGFLRLSYQIDAVSQGYELLRKHNGFFLADVVGLGKTIVATLIAKKFFFHNDFPTHISKILVVVPPALKESWQQTLEKFEVKTADIITNGSLHKVRDPKQYDLVIVDEAHKFRNDTADAYDELQRLCKTPTKRRLPDGTFAQKKVILVTATPLNNRPDDIRNLLFLFQDGKDSTLEVANLQRFFAARIKEYKAALKLKNVQEARRRVKVIYELIRTKVVADITMRRTRTDLQEHEQYKKDLDDQSIVFPSVEKPRRILYQLDPELEVLYDKTVSILKDQLTYNRYRAIALLKPDKKAKYQNADRVAGQLAHIMKTLLVKRLDSSFFAFTNSLHRFRDASEAMLKMMDQGRIYIAPNLDVSEYILAGQEDQLMERIAELQDTDPTISICTPEDFDAEFFVGLKQDHALLEELCNAWDGVKKRKIDPKLDEFVRRLSDELFSSEINHQGKLVVFSESKETTDYLKSGLAKHGFAKVLTVNSANRAERMPIVKANFDANVPLAEQADDYDIVISTEVLAEGINLHRANVVVNYDTPWNSIRLMQRIGRLNRIGTIAPCIHIYNFYPTAKVDDDIELKKKAIMKLQAFHSALGEDSQIYSTEEEFESFGLFDKDIQEGRDERLAYLMELRKFKEDSPELFRKIKKMPLRARAGRKDKTKTESTVTFIRNQRRDAFYFVIGKADVEELSFVETANAFRANVKEKATDLHDKHHDHINAALEDFREKLQAEAVEQRVVDAHQGPNERRALAYLDAFTNMPFASEEELVLMKAAKQAIKLAKFQNLQRDINKLQRSTKKTKVKHVDLLDKLMQIIRKYPLDTNDTEDDRPLVSVKTFEDLQPEIIISESYKGN